jgi:predicted ester cyclase
MSEANKLLARRWFEEVWNKKNESAIDKMFHQQGKSHGFPEPDSVLVGPEGFKSVHRVFCGAFPDLQINVEDILAEGDRVAVRWRVAVTHLGDHLGFAASGKKGVLDGSSFLIVKENMIAEGWNQMDLEALMQKFRVA